MEQYLSWRRELVENAREWAEHDIALFLNNRLNFQRGKRGSELENHSPWKTPEAALIDTYVELRGEEFDMWTEDEKNKIRRIMAACVSTIFSQILQGGLNLRATSFYDPLDYYFDEEQVILSEEEFLALLAVLQRIEQTLHSNIREFKRPRT